MPLDEIIDRLEQANKENQAKRLANRGILGETVATVGSGLIGLGENALHIVRGSSGDEGVVGRTATAGLGVLDRFQKGHPAFQLDPNKSGLSGFIEQTVSGGLASIPEMAAGAAGATVGAAAGGPVGAAAGLGVGFGVTSGLARYDEAKHKLIEGGMDPAKAAELAKKEALTEGAVAGAGGVALGAFGGKATAPLRKLATTAGIIGAQGTIGAGASSEIERQAKVPGAKGFFEAAKEAAPGAIGAGLIFGGMDALQIRKTSDEIKRRIANIEKLPEKQRTPLMLENHALYKRLLLESPKGKIYGEGFEMKEAAPEETTPQPKGEPSAETIREDKVKPPEPGVRREGIKVDSGGDIHKAEGEAGKQGEVQGGKVAASGLRPAVKVGDKMYSGEERGTHPDILEANKEIKAGTEDRGFVTPDGEYLTRSQGKEWLKTNKPDVFDKLPAGVRRGDDPLHSEALARAMGEKAGKAVPLEEIKTPEELNGESERQEQSGKNIERDCL